MSKGEKIFVTVASLFCILNLAIGNHVAGAICGFVAIMYTLIGIEEQL